MRCRYIHPGSCRIPLFLCEVSGDGEVPESADVGDIIDCLPQETVTGPFGNSAESGLFVFLK